MDLYTTAAMDPTRGGEAFSCYYWVVTLLFILGRCFIFGVVKKKSYQHRVYFFQDFIGEDYLMFLFESNTVWSVFAPPK